MESKKIENRNHDTWLKNYKGGSHRQAVRAWESFVDFLGDKTEDWVIENRLNEDWGTHLVDFRRFLGKKKLQRGRGFLSDNTTRAMSGLIRGYMVHVGCSLRLTSTQRQELVKVESTPRFDYPFNLRVKEKILTIADPLEEYVISVGVSFGLRTNDFLKITRGMLEPLLENEIPIQLPKINTKKRGVFAHPLIDRDGHEAIERRMKEMDNEGLTNANDKMCNLTAFELNHLLKRLFEKSNIELGNFRVRFHILRKFLTDQLANVCSEDKWKHFVGKSSKSPYVNHEGREAYKKVMEFTCVNGKRVRQSGSQALLLKQLELRDKEIESLKEEISRVIEGQGKQERTINALTNKYNELINIVEPFMEKQLEKAKKPKG